jgi:hypothetical protein
MGRPEKRRQDSLFDQESVGFSSADQQATLRRNRLQSKRKLNWYDDTWLILDKHFKAGRSIEDIAFDLQILPNVIQSRIEEMRKIPMGLQSLKDFEVSKGNLKTNPDRFPKKRQQTSSLKMVKAIALQIEKLAPLDPVFFENTIRFYVQELLEDERIILGIREWRSYDAGVHTEKMMGVQSVIKMVNKLGIDGLSVQYSSCLKNGELHNLASKLAAVGAPRDTSISRSNRLPANGYSRCNSSICRINIRSASETSRGR